MEPTEKRSRHNSGISSRLKPRRASSAVPDQTYAKKIQVSSQISTESCFYSFTHNANLADYLNSPYHSKLKDDASPSQSSEEELGAEGYVTFNAYFSNDHTCESQDATTLDELEATLDQPPKVGHAATLLFLRGHQPAKWLTLIGARYSVDPEFYRRHLEFSQASSHVELFSDSSLPSNNLDILHFRTTTIGQRAAQHGVHVEDRHENLRDLREQSDTMLGQYLNRLSLAKSGKVRHGDSIVRDFALHDRQYFSIEQGISIYISSLESGWVAIIWLDFGRNLGQCSPGPWLPRALRGTPLVSYWPTIQYRPGLILDSKKLQQLRLDSLNKVNDDDIAQTGRLLHEKYGHLLDASVMAQDVYYALTDVFRFVASSEAQYLDMSQALLRKEMDPALHSHGSGSGSINKTLTMWNLVYNKQLLDQHLHRLVDLMNFMEAHNSNMSSWPRAVSTTHRAVADSAARLLLLDFRHLASRATSLSSDYATSMTTLMNAAMIDESQKAIAQAEGVAKLTTLAFFFVPLSFTTSVFGMNFRELSDGQNLSMWVWATTAVGTLLVTFACVRWFSLREKIRARVLDTFDTKRFRSGID